MRLTKEECLSALMNICSTTAKMEDRKVFYELINEHFDNTEFEKLKKDFYMVCKLHDDLLEKYERLKDNQPPKFED